MNTNVRKKSLAGVFSSKPVATVFDDNPVAVSVWKHGSTRPLVCTAKANEVILTEWVRHQKDLIEEKLRQHGAILFRNFGIHSVPAFKKLVQSFSEDTMAYTQRSSPRTAISDNIYTSTDHPADQEINMHNELSYSTHWPMKIMFCCVQPPAQGGETPIADSREVYKCLREATRTRFREKGIMYLRNLSGKLGLPWTEVFQTRDPREAERACAKSGMQFAWKGPDHLEIKWTRPAVVQHPQTGETIWFNHGFFFNAHNLDAMVHEVVDNEANLPFNTFYGDGNPIEKDVIEELREAYNQTKCVFQWQQGDCILLDNMLVAHGRHPFAGERKIIVAMWEPNAEAS